MRLALSLFSWLAACPSSPGTPTDPVETADTSEPPVPDGLALVCTPDGHPLRGTCHVTVSPPQAVAVRFSRADGTGPVRTHTSDAVQSEHAVPLYLMAGEQIWDVVATAPGWPGREERTTFVTGRSPLETRLEVEGDASVGLVGTEHPCDERAIAVIYDTATGEVVWYDELDPEGELGLRHMVRFTDARTVLGETSRSIVERDLAGGTVARLTWLADYTELFHHDIFLYQDRYYLLYSQVEPARTLDALLVLDRSGQELARWNPSRYLDVPDDAIGEWMHVNSIAVDPAGDILLSLRTQTTIVKLDGQLEGPSFGQTIWTLAGGPPAGLGSDFDFDWTGIAEPHGFGEQHHVGVRRDGRLTLLDNANARGLVLDVDPTTGTVTVDGAWPTADLACLRQGTATETPSGNPFVGCYAGAVREYSLETGAVLWSGTPVCAASAGAHGVGSARWYPLDW